MSRTAKGNENSKILNINVIVLLTKKKKRPTKTSENPHREKQFSN